MANKQRFMTPNPKTPNTKPASKQYVLDKLAEYLDWSITYLRAVRAGNMDEAERLDAEYQRKIEQLEKDAEQ